MRALREARASPNPTALTKPMQGRDNPELRAGSTWGGGTPPLRVLRGTLSVKGDRRAPPSMQTDRRGRRGFWEHLDVRTAGRRGGEWVWSKDVNGSWEGFGGGGGQEVWMCYYAGDAAWGWGCLGGRRQVRGSGCPRREWATGPGADARPPPVAWSPCPCKVLPAPPPHLLDGPHFDPGLEASPGERSLQELGSAG